MRVVLLYISVILSVDIAMSPLYNREAVAISLIPFGDLFFQDNLCCRLANIPSESFMRFAYCYKRNTTFCPNMFSKVNLHASNCNWRIIIYYLLISKLAVILDPIPAYKDSFLYFIHKICLSVQVCIRAGRVCQGAQIAVTCRLLPSCLLRVK